MTGGAPHATARRDAAWRDAARRHVGPTADRLGRVALLWIGLEAAFGEPRLHPLVRVGIVVGLGLVASAAIARAFASIARRGRREERGASR